MNTCDWPLPDGRHLTFQVYESNTNWNKIGGLYIFTHQKNGYWYALYVGQAADFSSRLPSHERLNDAVRLGATHIHALPISSSIERDMLEKQLIQHLQPPINQQFRGLGRLAA